MQKPSIGRIVIVPMKPSANNGADEAPAVVTRVWSVDEANERATVNLRVLNDGTEVEWRTSVYLYADREAAEAAESTYCAWWPPRV